MESNAIMQLDMSQIKVADPEKAQIFRTKRTCQLEAPKKDDPKSFVESES